MLQDTKKMTGRIVQASDGEVGHVCDFLVDDASWSLRYLVVQTGPWLEGRKILLTPESFERNALYISDPLPTGLSRTKIASSPLFETDQVIYRAYEKEYYDYYGWSAYWENPNSDANAVSAMIGPAQMREIVPDRIHLRSVSSIAGFRLHANDGATGHVASFTIDTRRWTVGAIVVETGHWYAGKQILVLTESVERINYDDSAVFVRLSLEDIRSTRANAVAQASVALYEPLANP